MGGAKQRAAETRAPALRVRERILEAALRILHESGLRHLTQVKVAERAGVRQSHLTYYFPTRQHLLEAVTAQFVEEVTRGVREAIANAEDVPSPAVLRRLVDAIANEEHTRMFMAMIVESDEDPALRAMIVRATRQVEAALAEVLGGPDAQEQARLTLAAVWGLAFYLFVMRPSSRTALVRPYVALLAARAGRRQ